jgi:hypothetical protein
LDLAVRVSRVVQAKVRPTFKVDPTAPGVRADLAFPVDTRASLDLAVRVSRVVQAKVRPTFKVDPTAPGVRADLAFPVDTRASRPSASKTRI